jgi:hypothetical protein
MNNPKNALMQKMTDKVMRGGASPVSQDSPAKQAYTDTDNIPLSREIIKHRKDGSVKKKIQGGRITHKSKTGDDGQERIVTKYRKDGSVKKKVHKKAVDTGIMSEVEIDVTKTKHKKPRKTKNVTTSGSTKVRTSKQHRVSPKTVAITAAASLPISTFVGWSIKNEIDYAKNPMVKKP